MKIKYSLIGLILNTVIFISCAVQGNIVFVPIPDESFFYTRRNLGIELNDIIQTKSGTDVRFIPQWLHSYINGGIEAVESINSDNDKYFFVGSNRGGNFAVLNIWSDFFSVKQDISPLVAVRIENRMIYMASLYPDDEYGLFFERLMKNVYNSAFPDAVKEDTYWIKVRNDNGNNSELYMFFILASMDRLKLQAVITEMMDKTVIDVAPPGRRSRRGFSEFASAQAAAVNNLRQTFFEGF